MVTTMFMQLLSYLILFHLDQRALKTLKP
jgi:hypothetical protein